MDGFLGEDEIRRSLKTRDWEKAQQKIRDCEAEGAPIVEKHETKIEEACNAFENDATARGLREPTLKKYRVLFKQLRAFATKEGLVLIKQFEISTLRRFRETWSDGGISALKKLERLGAFFRFVHESGWIKENPTKHLKKPRVEDIPTLPFERDEMISILAACDRMTDNYGNTGGDTARKVRALVLLLRYSGMRIGDTVTCPVASLSGNRLFLYTQKTRVPVTVPLPDVAVEALNVTPKVSEKYFFWTGTGEKGTVAGNWRRSLRKLFALAGIKDGHPHRFRDTFAVELLRSGVPLQRVSVLLGHKSVKVTERHYSPWIQALQDQLEADVMKSFSTDPIILAGTKGTPEVHCKKEAVN